MLTSTRVGDRLCRCKETVKISNSAFLHSSDFMIRRHVQIYYLSLYIFEQR